MSVYRSDEVRRITVAREQLEYNVVDIALWKKLERPKPTHASPMPRPSGSALNAYRPTRPRTIEMRGRRSSDR